MEINYKIIKLKNYPFINCFYKVVILSISLMMIGESGYSQDPSFSQFYSNPIYLNPALAGTGDCSRLIFNYRKQWPSLSNDFTTYSASADHYLNALSGGIGVILSSDNAGSGMMNTMRVSGVYSYHLKISNNLKLNAGFEATFHQRKLNWDKLVYSDMIDPVSGGIYPSNSGENVVDNTAVSTPDFSAGLVLGIKEKYYMGFATHHLTEPGLNYYNNSDNNFLYRKYTFHAGAYFNLSGNYYRSQRSDFFLSPNILYQYQQGMQQINLGLYLQRTPLIVGVWYRHNVENADGAIFLVGLNLKRFNFGYSYDLTLSKLRNATGGSHEVSVSMLFNCNKKRNRPGAIKCPEF